MMKEKFFVEMRTNALIDSTAYDITRQRQRLIIFTKMGQLKLAMTVDELITDLQQMPPDAEIWVWSPWMEDWAEAVITDLHQPIPELDYRERVYIHG